MTLGRKTGGRQRGTPNRFTTFSRALIEDALQELGGSAWLVKLGQEEPVAFAQLLGKLLPRQTNLDTPKGSTLAELLEQVQASAVTRADLEARRSTLRAPGGLHDLRP